MTSSAVYLGESRFDAIWKELDDRAAVVFVHGTQTSSSKPYPHEWLGLPVTEVPNETFKAAAHLVVTGTKRRYPNVKIILAHFGGTLTAVMPRVAALSTYMGCNLTAEEILEDFGTFYLDSALSAHASTMRLAESLVGRGKMLFGTDFPGERSFGPTIGETRAENTCAAVSMATVAWFTKNMDEYYAGDTAAQAEVMRETALTLFPRFLEGANPGAIVLGGADN